MSALESSKGIGQPIFTIPSGFTFGCLGVETHVSADLYEPINLEDGVFALGKVPFELEQFWVQEIGTGQTRLFYRSNLAILAMSDSPGTSDDWLRRIATTYYYALLLNGVAYSSRGLAVGGYSSSEGAIYESSLMPMDNFNRPHSAPPHPVDKESLTEAVKVAHGLRVVFADETAQDYLRLRKGVNALLEGIMEDQAHTRLPYLVRSIEAIIRPSLDRIREDFVRRCQVFAGDSAATETILNQIYDLRVFADHIYPMREATSGCGEFEKDRVIALRTYQAELLSTYILRHALTNDGMRDSVRSEDSLTEFWYQVENEGKNLWGPPVDLETAEQRIL